MGQVTPEMKGVDKELAEQSMLLAMNDDAEVDNDNDDDNLDTDHNDADVDNDVDDNNLDADHDDDVPLRFCSITDILGTAGFAPRAQVVEELHMVSSDEPTSFTEAERSPSWRKAMIEEMTSIKENDTWSLIDFSPGHKPIGVKWVFKVKRNKHEVVSKYKARLMVKSYMQQHNIDYDEVFTPVARLDSVRLFIALVAHEGWEVNHMDVKSMFLNDDL
jgi:hypothetical protein